MHIFRVLPVLTLLLGARASPVDSSDPAPYRLDVRADNITQVCFPGSAAGVAPGVDSQTSGSTFHLRFMPEYVSERSAECVCFPATGIPADVITDGGFDTVGNGAALGVCDRRFKLCTGGHPPDLIPQLNPDTQGCAYPTDGVPSCTTENPCAYTCKNGNTPTTSNGLPSCASPST